ncbi:MAG: DUF3458 domain-containing protein, partial [Bacteriovoracia bacterium]
KYFELYDGQAVTTEDFLYAMSEASGFDFSEFEKWYHQAGTPVVKVDRRYDEDKKLYQIEFYQPDSNKTFHIPMRLGLLQKDGKEIDLKRDNDLFHLTHAKEKMTFENISAEPIPSLNRHFSAPIKLEIDYRKEELLTLMKFDADLFNRWEASQKLWQNEILSLSNNPQKEIDKDVLYAIKTIVTDTLNSDVYSSDYHFLAQQLTLPSEIYLNDLLSTPAFDAIHEKVNYLKEQITNECKNEFVELYHKLHSFDDYQRDQLAIGKRALKNRILDYLVSTKEKELADIALKQFTTANNMTDQFGAFNCIVSQLASNQFEYAYRDEVIERFYKQWHEDSLVMNKWLSSQAASCVDNDIYRIAKLEKDRIFDLKEPNKIYALYRTFANLNITQFNNPDGSGYSFIAERILKLDEINSRVASSLALAFKRYQKLDHGRKEAMKQQLERIIAKPHLSKDTFEIVSKILS